MTVSVRVVVGAAPNAWAIARLYCADGILQEEIRSVLRLRKSTGLKAAQRVGIQLPQARWERLQKADDLAREAVGCNAGLGGNRAIASDMATLWFELLKASFCRENQIL